MRGIAEDDQLLRDRCRRRQAGPRVRARHDPLLPSRGAGARPGGDVRSRRAADPRAGARRLRRARRQGPRLVRRHRGRDLSACRARGRGGAAREGPCVARRLRRAAACRALHASHGDRRKAGAPARGPATLCADVASRPGRGPAGRTDPGRPRRGCAGRQLVAERRGEGHLGGAVTTLPTWAEWSPAGAEAPWTLGLEEEVMLLEPKGWSLASRIDDVLPALSAAVAEHATAETHGSALELFTRPHATAAAAAAELSHLRGRLAADLAPLDLRAAVAGTHPFAQWNDVEVSPGARYQSIYATMRELARRE